MNFRLIFVTIISIFVVIACCDRNDNDIVVPTSPPECDRTVLVYMVASNTLSFYAETNISSISDAIEEGALNGGNFLVYVDKYNSLPTLEQLQLVDGVVKRTVIKTYDNDNSASAEVMKMVLTDVKELRPAKSYGMILWSHASGWYPTSSYNSMLSSRSFGDDEGVAMNIPDIAEAIPDGMLDFILCDACYMGAVEVAHEWRNDCRYLIASPTAIMGVGFPYRDIVAPMFDTEYSLSENLQVICEKYMEYYRDYRDPYASISLINVSETNRLAHAVRDILADNLRTVSLDSVQQFSQERGAYTSFEDMFYDLNHYIKMVSSDTLLYKNFEEALENVVLFADATEYYLSNVRGLWCKYPIKHFCGLSAYVLGAVTDEKIESFYRTLSWYKKVYTEEIEF